MLSLEEQYRVAVNQDEFLDRVAAAAMAMAVTSLLPSTPDNPNPTRQAQRVALALDILLTPKKGSPQFAWWIVMQPAVTSVDVLTDDFIRITMTQAVFDIVGAILYRGVTAP